MSLSTADVTEGYSDTVFSKNLGKEVGNDFGCGKLYNT